MLGSLGRCVSLVAATSALTSAFLIPPGFAPSPDSSVPDLAVSVIDPKSKHLTLPCAECAFPIRQPNAEDTREGENGFLWIQGGANSVKLDFTISEDGKQLEVNGRPIYPPEWHEGSYLKGNVVYVEQVPSFSAAFEDSEDENVRKVALAVTGSRLMTAPETALTPNGDVLAPIRYQIFTLEDQPVTLDEVNIKLLRTGEGELLIMELTTTSNESEGPEDGEDGDFFPFHPHHGPPYGPPPTTYSEDLECKTLPPSLCRLKNMFDAKISGLSHGGPGRQGGCGGRNGAGKHLPSHIKAPFMHPGHEDGPDGHHHRPRPHHFRPHGPHHHGHRHHRPQGFADDFLHAFGRGFVAILIPVFTGLFIGIAFSLIGMLLGRLIGYMWIQLARGGRRGTANAAHEEQIMEAGEDKGMLEQELPVYEDVPAYEEVTAEK